MPTLEFDRLPSLGAQYARALFTRHAKGTAIPRLDAVAKGVTSDPARLAAYRRVCGFASGGVPATWPQVLATPLHAALLGHAAFPLPMLGLVHVRNRIEQRRALGVDEPLDLHCFLEGQREAKRGVEFDLVTRATAAGAVAWEATTTILSRTKTPPSGPRVAADTAPGEAPGAARSVLWRVGADLGRRYAGVSGDYNPIHLTAATAKAFGFPRAIAQGAWLLARAVAESADLVPGDALAIDVAFKKPVPLPSTVLFTAHCREAGADFGVWHRDGAGQHLAGSVQRLS